MIAAVDLFPDRDPQVKVRDDDEERWGALRVVGKHVLGERTGVAKYTVFDGWSLELPEGIEDDLRFVCVPERRLPDLRIMAVPNTVNLVALAFALLSIYAAWNGSAMAILGLVLVAAYLALIRRIAGQIHARRKRGQERLFRNQSGEVPGWVSTQQWVAWTGTEYDARLLEHIGYLQGELIGYDVGLACLNGRAWLLADDPFRQGPPPVLGKDRLLLPRSAQLKEDTASGEAG